ncbi:methyltransferase domain-containing protein [Aliifodinibius sp. S!AR15-10]|uniref:class I SAM-dependent methyltransferase n=1 Tax=Aliifodinibius sp. S!AR15-10 TaxID=2950437 RepID=UPI0028582156|nr:methyltransferase domain-containing protein [Aliifodinibius sp. S!AR15-10]MDR8393531.1 methyltransferase domain-containing protein [Aliifodinibius sp. S!AR15-10]
MSKIAYDPVKDRFAAIIRRSSFLRTLFYKLLDLFFLRSWYVRRVLRTYATPLDELPEWKLLDAGTGFGQYDRFLLMQFSNIKVKGIDVKEDYLSDCRIYFQDQIDRGKIQFQKQDLLEIDYEGEFDFTICIDVLEHIEEDEKVIGNLAKALKPSGYFLMHSPSHYSESDAGDEDTFVGEHARAGYSKEDITEKIKRAGLHPVEVNYTYGKLGHFAWMLIIKYPMLLLNKINLLALPLLAIYYLPVLPIALLLMKLDMNGENEWGTGIYALARKP